MSETRSSSWAAVVALAVGIFVLITIEELPIGVLTLMAADLGVSTGVAGLAVTLPGLLAGVVGLLTPVMVGWLDRRLVLVIALASVVISCGLSVVSPTIGLLLASRVFTGFAIGLYWAVLPVVALRQVPARHASRALTVAFSGVGGALVLGVPLAAWIGAQIGWRASFAAVGGLAALVLVAILLLVRPVHAEQAVTLAQMRQALGTRGIRYGITLTLVIVTAQFVSYSYVSPILQTVAGVPVGQVSVMLLVYGIAGLIGNFAVGPLLRRSPGAAVLLIAAGVTVSVAAMLLVVRSPLLAAVVMPVWGLFAGAVSVAIQAFVTREAAQHEEAGTAANSAAFAVAIATGAAIGGQVIDAFGVHALMGASLVMLVVGLAVAVRWQATSRQS